MATFVLCRASLSMIPPLPAANSGYLQQNYAQAVSDLAAADARLQAIRADLDQHYPACERAAEAMQQALRETVREQTAVILQDSRRSVRGKALSLRAVSAGWKTSLLLWLALLGIGPWLTLKLLPLFGTPMPFLQWLSFLSQPWHWGLSGLVFYLANLLPWALLYAGLVKFGGYRLSRSNTTQSRALIQAFGTSRISLMQFATQHSGDDAYPYPATRAPWPERDVLDSWRIDAGHGDMRGATFACFHLPADQTALHSLLRLDGQPVLVPIKGQQAPHEWQWLTLLTQRGAAALAAHAAPIRELAVHAEALRSQQAQVQALQRRVKTLHDVQTNWTDVAIDAPVLDQVLKLVDLFVSGRKPAPKGILMYGPPGTGKTLIARKLARHAGCHFESVTIADLKGQHIGHTGPKVKAIWERCRKHAPTLLFVDECESAFARRGGVDNDQFGNELVQTFLAEWDGIAQAAGKVFVIGATNRRDIIDDAIVSRFTTMVEIGLPNAEARRRILAHELHQAGIALVIPDALVTETSGMSGRDLHTLVASIVAEHLNGVPDADALLAAVRRIRGKGSTRVKALGWDDIVLPPSTREEFVGLGKELRNAEQLASLGIPAPRGILLYGPPGTGKTQIARVLASQSGLGFVAATTSDMKANYIGQSGSKVKALFEKARAQAPCILFIDEIDIVAPSRDGGGDSFSQEIVGQMLQELDGVANKDGQVFLLAASNHPERIDSALLSRMERKVEIGLPDRAGRAAIIALQLSGKPLAFDPAAVTAQLADRTEGYSGRDLQSLVTRATRRAVKRAMLDGDDASATRLELGDLEEAIGSAEPA